MGGPDYLCLLPVTFSIGINHSNQRIFPLPGCRARSALFKSQVQKRALALELLVNFLFPWLCYRMARPGLGETRALLEREMVTVAGGFFETSRGISVTI